MNNDIDLVIPYVDSTDKNWQDLFDKYNPISDKEIEGINARNRFRGQGEFFKYWFRAVQSYMPWIRKIHLVVQSESQIPNWLNREEIHIVYHKDIIPEEYLPTFNSTCIEMFLWRIDGLSERFIYANDDFYPINNLKPDYFFENNLVKNNSMCTKFNNTMYQHHCLNAYCLAFNCSSTNVKNILLYRHCMRPYLRSHMEKSFIAKQEEILNTLTRFRDTKNINIYYFDNCLIKDSLQKPRLNINSKCITNNTSSEDMRSIIYSSCNMLAIQDCALNENVYENFTLNNLFRNKFPYKSKYEK